LKNNLIATKKDCKECQALSVKIVKV
jgi:hypothetical protein